MGRFGWSWCLLCGFLLGLMVHVAIVQENNCLVDLFRLNILNSISHCHPTKKSLTRTRQCDVFGLNNLLRVWLLIGTALGTFNLCSWLGRIAW